MGDRVLVTFTDSDGEYSPAVYMHWSGSNARSYIELAAPLLRAGDASYSSARFCGYCHTVLEGNLGLGLMAAPEQDENGIVDLEAYSQGDAGVYVVNVNTGEVAAHGGYGGSFKLDTDKFWKG